MSCEGQCKVAIATDLSGTSLSQFACQAVKLVKKSISIRTSNFSPTHIIKWKQCLFLNHIWTTFKSVINQQSGLDLTIYMTINCPFSFLVYERACAVRLKCTCYVESLDSPSLQTLRHECNPRWWFSRHRVWLLLNSWILLSFPTTFNELWEPAAKGPGSGWAYTRNDTIVHCGFTSFSQLLSDKIFMFV